MPTVREQEWRDLGRTTKWPFSDAATLVNVAGDALDDPMFIDASLYPVGASNGAYLGAVVVDGDTVTVEVSQEGGLLCFAGFDRHSPPEELAFEDVYGRPAGVAVCTPASLYAFQFWTEGRHEFNREQTELAAGVILPRPEPGVSGLLLEDGTLLTGEVYFVGGRGVLLQVVNASRRLECGDYVQEKSVIVNVVGDPLSARGQCEDVGEAATFDTPRFIREIVFRNAGKDIICHPNADGGIDIMAGSLLRPRTAFAVTTNSSGIQLSMVGN